ncbi:unnamed protein product [Caenorhabditis auriculariae]|uniref:Transposase n=1 Tax=Caenorhabditis auriculariae TaxID=2777116 RepID=A0A8S1HPR5_9PELO|nr:unnamed protein product [Caenorhabditis auriculariae]
MGRWVPYPLTDYGKDRRVDMALSFLTLHRTHEWLDNIITGDEYGSTKMCRQKDVAEPDLRAKNVMLDVHQPQRLHLPAAKAETRRRKRRGNQAVIYFQHDNARPHIARSTKAKLETYGWHVLPHPPYSPDLAPSNHYLFSELQRALAGQKFDNEKQVRPWLTNWFKAQPATFWRQGIYTLPRQWQQTIDAHGEYF